MTQARKTESTSCHLVKVNWRGCQAPTLGRRKEDREEEQEREGERVRERVRGKVKCHPNAFPKVGVSSLGYLLTRMPNHLARCPCAKWRGAPAGMGGIPGAEL
jgi:hypothetical protein